MSVERDFSIPYITRSLRGLLEWKRADNFFIYEIIYLAVAVLRDMDLQRRASPYSVNIGVRQAWKSIVRTEFAAFMWLLRAEHAQWMIQMTPLYCKAYANLSV